MKILVIDDNIKHVEAAKSQLAEHELVTVTTFCEARIALGGDDEAKYDLLRDFQLADTLGKTEDELLGLVEQRVAELSGHKFDVVLTDLLMPAPSARLGGRGERFIGQETSLGDMLLLAALNAGVKKVGLLTDSDHHSHPASAAVDMFRGQVMEIGNARIVLHNEAMTEDGSGNRVKNWKDVLTQLVEVKTPKA